MPNAPTTHRQAMPPPRRVDRRQWTAQERGYTKSLLRRMDLFRQMEIAESANASCRYCGRYEAVMIDHGLPPLRYHMPGTAEYEMMMQDDRLWVPCCRACNTAKGDRKPHELQAGTPRQRQIYERLKVLLNSRGITV